MKKRMLLYGIAVIVLIGVLAYPWFRPGPGVTVPNCLCIRPGMSNDEVETLLSGPSSRSWRRGTPVVVPNQGCVEYWCEHGRGGWFIVFYDVINQVVDTRWDADRGCDGWIIHDPVRDLLVAVGFWRVRE